MKSFIALPILAGLISMAFINHRSKPKTGIPKYKHIIVVIEENHDFDALVASKNSPYISWLAQNGVLFTDSHGVTHPSEPNYLAIFSGSTQGITDDKCLLAETPYHTPNLGAALIGKGLTFKGYAETMPNAGYLPCYYKKSTITNMYLYGRKHAPWVNWTGTGTNTIPADVSLPISYFPRDFADLPTVSFVIPNMDNDMHNIGALGDDAAIQRGDKWLKEHLEEYAKWAKKHDSLLIITFDEDDSRTAVNRIPTIFYGAHIKPGKYDEHINHYSVLHTLETMYGLPVADNQPEAAITDVWK